MRTIPERLSQMKKINTKINELLQKRYTDERRLTLPLAYLRLSLDHHRAIILLMKNELYGSAMALVRPVFEEMIRAHWVADEKCASNAQVDQVAENDDFKFPNMNDMTKAVDQAYSDPTSEKPPTFFQQTKKDAWNAINSYTHSGLLQLARQFSGDRVEAKYPEQDLISGLNTSTASILLLGCLVATRTGQHPEADEIEKLFDFGKA
jgi:hypothetical protein